MGENVLQYVEPAGVGAAHETQLVAPKPLLAVFAAQTASRI